MSTGQGEQPGVVAVVGQLRHRAQRPHVARRVGKCHRARQSCHPFAGDLVVQPGTGQAFDQTRMQAKHAVGDRTAFATRGRFVHCDQFVRQREHVRATLRAMSVAQEHLHQVVLPMLFEELRGHRRQRPSGHALRKRGGRLQARLQQALASVHGFRGASLDDFRAPALLLQQVIQFLRGDLEDRHVLVVFGDHARHRRRRALEQLAVLRRSAVVALATQGQRIEQAARRVVRPHEEVLVGERDAHVRHHQSREQPARLPGQRMGLQQRFEHQPDHVDRVFVMLAEAGVLGIQTQAARGIEQLVANRQVQVAVAGQGEFERLDHVALEQRGHGRDFMRAELPPRRAGPGGGHGERYRTRNHVRRAAAPGMEHVAQPLVLHAGFRRRAEQVDARTCRRSLFTPWQRRCRNGLDAGGRRLRPHLELHLWLRLHLRLRLGHLGDRCRAPARQ